MIYTATNQSHTPVPLLISKMLTVSNYPFFLQADQGNFGANNSSKTGQNKSQSSQKTSF